MSFDVEITVSGMGTDQELGERIFDALVSVAPASDPVAHQDLHAGTLTASLSSDAPGIGAAIDEATAIFDSALSKVDNPRQLTVQVAPRAA